MLELKIDCALSCWQGDLFNLFLPRNLINLGDILVDGLVQEPPKAAKKVFNTHLADKAVQERLPKLMAVRVPIQAVRFAERVELFNVLRDAIKTQKRNGE